uniref:CCHC-type domain-containing protein n=1 Tax=Romanomermis culicivorax TaxID=13658 RepID=A0A915JHS3_ROMCU
MPDWCRKCMKPGHIARYCTTESDNPPNGSYAAAVRGKPIPKSAARIAPSLTQTEEAGGQVPATTQPDTDRNAETNVLPAETNTTTTLEVPDTTKIIPFISYKNYLSNHHIAPFSVDRTNFKSTEHYLFYQKAKLNGQNEAANTILNARTAAIAKRIGDAIVWDTAKHGPWREWAYRTLFAANGYKYEQNPELRAKFFQTSPAQLVEANAYDLYWGCGLSIDDPEISRPENYPGDFNFVENKDIDRNSGQTRKETGKENFDGMELFWQYLEEAESKSINDLKNSTIPFIYKMIRITAKKAKFEESQEGIKIENKVLKWEQINTKLLYERLIKELNINKYPMDYWNTVRGLPLIV